MKSNKEEKQLVKDYLLTLSENDPKWKRYNECPDQAYWDALMTKFSNERTQEQNDYLKQNFKMLLPDDGKELVNVIKKNKLLDKDDLIGLNKKERKVAKYLLSARKIAKAVRPLLIKIAENNGPWSLSEVNEILVDFEESMEECIADGDSLQTIDEVKYYKNISVRELFENEFIPYIMNVEEL